MYNNELVARSRCVTGLDLYVSEFMWTFKSLSFPIILWTFISRTFIWEKKVVLGRCFWHLSFRHLLAGVPDLITISGSQTGYSCVHIASWFHGLVLTKPARLDWNVTQFSRTACCQRFGCNRLRPLVWLKEQTGCLFSPLMIRQLSCTYYLQVMDGCDWF